MPVLLRNARVAVCAAMVAGTPAGAESFDRGQALYENHCQTCHEKQVHQRDARRAASLADLQKSVSTWSWHAALDWSAEDIADVVDYLNRQFYHFPEPAER